MKKVDGKLCHQVFATKEDLETHKQADHKPIYFCNRKNKKGFCKRSFREKSELLEHNASVHGDINYVCEKEGPEGGECGKRFLNWMSQFGSTKSPSQC
jgi:hypothetical protein